jgi:mediator of DNA damage checkpoint protein 1
MQAPILLDSDGEDINRSAKKGSVIKTYRTRSRSRSRGRAELHVTSNRDARQSISRSPYHVTKGDHRSILRDGGEVSTVPVLKSMTPPGLVPKGRRKPALPSDTEESEVDEVRSLPNQGRKSSLASQATNGVARTPNQEMSVLLPTLAQVRTANSQQADKSNPPAAGITTTSQTMPPNLRAQSVTVKVSQKRGRPRKKPSEDSVPVLLAESKCKPSPVRLQTSSTAHTTGTTSEARLIRTGLVPESSTRIIPQRSAATKATQKLHNEIMPDVMSFQKEIKSGNVKSAVDVEKANARKTVTEERKLGRKRASLENDSAQRSDGDEPETKRQKTLVGIRKVRRKSDMVHINEIQGKNQPAKSLHKPSSREDTPIKSEYVFELL